MSTLEEKQRDMRSRQSKRPREGRPKRELIVNRELMRLQIAASVLLDNWESYERVAAHLNINVDLLRAWDAKFRPLCSTFDLKELQRNS